MTRRPRTDSAAKKKVPSMATTATTATTATMRIMATVIMATNRRLTLRGRRAVGRNRDRAHRSPLVIGRWVDHGNLVGPLSG